MKLLATSLLAFVLSGCAGTQMANPTVSIMVDLDPTSVEPTVIIESITADRAGLLYAPDRVTGNILRVDPKSPKPMVVGKIESRTVDGKKVAPSPSGILFDAKRDLYVAIGLFSEVVRIKAPDISGVNWS